MPASAIGVGMTYRVVVRVMGCLSISVFIGRGPSAVGEAVVVEDLGLGGGTMVNILGMVLAGEPSGSISLYQAGTYDPLNLN